MPNSKTRPKTDKPRCGLCGKTRKLTRTECCGNWICDDEDKYVLFSYARNSCHRNHSRYTLCAFHHNEGHKGDWKTCPKCRKAFETEMYVWYATNEYNFEKLENPPDYEPTKCSKCGVVIKMGTDGFTRSQDEYWCEACGVKEMQKATQRASGRVPEPPGDDTEVAHAPEGRTGDTWVTDIRHYLDEDGNFAVESGPARRIAEYQCSIVEAVTSRPVDADWMTDIRCRRRPGHKPCIGPIIAGYDEDDSTTIVWGCPVCGDEGYISGWQETQWDRRRFC